MSEQGKSHALPANMYSVQELEKWAMALHLPRA